jgi:hypothetical protein
MIEAEVFGSAAYFNDFFGYLFHLISSLLSAYRVKLRSKFLTLRTLIPVLVSTLTFVIETFYTVRHIYFSSVNMIYHLMLAMELFVANATI